MSIKIFTLSTCSHCRALKKFLDQHDISYDFTDVDLLESQERGKAIEELRKINPRCSFPTSVIGDKVISGFKEKEIEEALGI
ncbi:MAG: glutaredoxin family protein [Deltaproteobacteria bacterium]|nr:glutaredoxin family protein [Deltaproteobacteria bacterium]